MIEELAITILVLLNQVSVVPESQNKIGFFSQFIKDESVSSNPVIENSNYSYYQGNLKHGDVLKSLPVKDASAPALAVEAKASIAFDSDTDLVLYSQNTGQKLPIASLTKIMTALVVLEEMDLDKTSTVSKNALSLDIEKKKNTLQEGERIKTGNLLKVMLIESNNAAAYSLAENTAGSVDEFVELMNAKAKLLGLKNTRFSNPSGLDQEGNYSTAYDVAQMVDFAINKKFIWDILKTKSATVSSLDGKAEHRLRNTNLLLGRIPHIIGGKTGFTDEAGECLVLIVEDAESGRKVVTVVLGAKDRFAETEKIVRWVFKNYRW